ncbi:Adenylate and Guanylate cyclase catalytic domain-containing protein [Luteibacter sp. UNC138MFCol5.1]|uniref:adenylate/guanylate cyclase domain-containing protein n=1 Tax=Luteibacter sp. UNC138MFCol5.1 TaxID=1502774 RepID=UPI0008C7F418|nr:adenylate/guanylate cyclase domain-containing protein [Luteibacter sp. UNC138MFCol5.1]SEO46278.1 Adenylate and Guanylate cyclase catalytic domain-containing protein [Luteibacter sp. UNC138MFCol5.1]
MGRKADLESWCNSVFRDAWETRQGAKVPDEDSKLSLMNEAIELEATVLYADMADSTKLVDTKKASFAAEIYKTFLHCAARIIQHYGGAITAYDGDRIMAVFIGDQKNTNAVNAALEIRWAVLHIITPQMKRTYQTTDYVLRHVTGVDSSSLFVAKTGVRGANDLVWVGRAANHAAKLSSLPSDYIYITKAVYGRLNDSAKLGSNGKNMWEPRTWTFNDQTIYRSNWTRSIG